MNDIRKKLGTLNERCAQIHKITSETRDTVGYCSRLQCLGDAEHDYYFAGSQMPEIEELNLSIHKSVTEVTTDLTTLFVEQMGRIEQNQEMLENQQDELHAAITEMHGMVMQQANCMQALMASMHGLEECFLEATLAHEPNHSGYATPMFV